MKISISGSRGEVSVNWTDYALLRDNIQHFMECGSPSSAFSSIHSIERAVDEGSVSLDAARLRSEIMDACYGLRELHMRDCAVSVRTRAIVTGCPKLPVWRGTTCARFADWALPIDENSDSLVHYLQRFVNELMTITYMAPVGDKIEVRLIGARPRHVRKDRPRAVRAPLPGLRGGRSLRRPRPTLDATALS